MGQGRHWGQRGACMPAGRTEDGGRAGWLAAGRGPGARVTGRVLGPGGGRACVLGLGLVACDLRSSGTSVLCACVPACGEMCTRGAWIVLGAVRALRRQLGCVLACSPPGGRGLLTAACEQLCSARDGRKGLLNLVLADARQARLMPMYQPALFGTVRNTSSWCAAGGAPGGG